MGNFLFSPSDNQLKETSIMLEWSMFSALLLGVGLAIFSARSFVRREMLWVSLLTMPLGLTGPIFVPKYWNPPSYLTLPRELVLTLKV